MAMPSSYFNDIHKVGAVDFSFVIRSSMYYYIVIQSYNSQIKHGTSP
jgi:hypothetical protein